MASVGHEGKSCAFGAKGRQIAAVTIASVGLAAASALPAWPCISVRQAVTLPPPNPPLRHVPLANVGTAGPFKATRETAEVLENCRRPFERCVQTLTLAETIPAETEAASLSKAACANSKHSPRLSRTIAARRGLAAMSSSAGHWSLANDGRADGRAARFWGTSPVTVLPSSPTSCGSPSSSRVDARAAIPCPHGHHNVPLPCGRRDMPFLPRADVAIILRGRVRHIFQALGPHVPDVSPRSGCPACVTYPECCCARHPPPTPKPIVVRVRVLYIPHPPSVKKVGARGKAGERMW